MANLPQDIFQDVEPTPQPVAPRPGTPRPVQQTPTPPRSPLPHRSRLTWLLAGALVLLLGVGAVAYLVRRNAAPANNTNTQSSANVNVASGAPSTTTTAHPEPVAGPPDADADGLPDDEEASLGTNANVPDSDGDGLSDYDEVKIYHTNPLKPDTDGDGNRDGAEVKKGYNPNGSGLLLNLDAAKQQSNTNATRTSP